MSVAGTVTSFITGTYTVTRTPAATFVDGWAVPGTATTLSIEAGVYPLTGRELEVMSEGQHGSEVRQLYTLTELWTRTPTHEPDQVTVDGELWTVQRLDKYPSYYRALIARTAVP